MKKYSVFVQKITSPHRSGKYTSTHKAVYKATFSNIDKAISVAKSYLQYPNVNYIVVYELDTANQSSYTTGRQMSSGVYYTKARSVNYYSDKKVVFEAGFRFASSSISKL